MIRLLFLFALVFALLPTVSSYFGQARPAAPRHYAAIRFDSLDRVDAEEEWYPTEETSALLADRLRCIEQTIPLACTDRVRSFINYFTVRNRDYTRMVLNRLDLYFPLFSKYLAEHNLPDELKYLAIVESGLSPVARSRAGAVGLWQFMPATGRHLGLTINEYIDERNNPEKSTQAACRYLAELHAMFGSWQLALMAYNSGPGSVRSAIRHAGRNKSVESVCRYLPAETRSYLSQFTAIKYAVNYGDNHNLFALQKEMPLACDTLVVRGVSHLPTLALLTGIGPDSLSRLNPVVRRGVLPKSGGPYVLQIPYSAKAMLEKNRATILDSAYRVGQRQLLVIEKIASEGAQVLYRVKYGDVLGSIARKFGVRVSDIQRWNKIKGSAIYAGQRLTLWVPARYAKTSS